jgi:uncharacterized protein
MVTHNKSLRHIGKFLICMILSLTIFNFIANINVEFAEGGGSVKDKRVYDDAGILTDDEIKELEANIKKNEEASGIEIYILIHDNNKSTSPERYIEDFEDLLPVGDRVHFLYDLHRGEIWIEGYGLAETYIHSKRIDKILDKMEDDIRSKDYTRAFNTYITMSADYMADDSVINTDHNYNYESPLEDNMFFNFWIQILISLGIGAIVVGIMLYNSGGKMTVGSNDYLDRRRQCLIGKRDQYIRTSVTKTRKPSQNSSSGGSNSGGFRGGTSSGGRSHSSGGRKL